MHRPRHRLERRRGPLQRFGHSSRRRRRRGELTCGDRAAGFHRPHHERFGNGINLNIKFDADTVAGQEGRAVLEALLRGYFAQGGMQVQLNVLDPKVLEEAMTDPGAHRNLLVRISGYSAYFVDLTPEMQQEILDRSRQRAR